MTQDALSGNRAKVLTREIVQARIDAMWSVQNDPEAAHAEEDTLYRDVLNAIATGQFYGIEAAQLARLALETQRMKFPRWAA